MARGYQIMDEPLPGGMAQFAVQPFWPLIAVMFGGTWLSWPWFVFNGFAIGSPTRRREAVFAACGFVGSILLILGLDTLSRREILPAESGPYLFLVILVWKLGVSYWLYALQSRTFGLYEFYGGTVRNGLIVIVAAYFVRPLVLRPLFEAYPLLAMALV